MSWPQLMLSILFAFFLGLPMALFFAYTVGVQYERERWPSWVPIYKGLPIPAWLRGVFTSVAAVCLLIDVLANWTVLSLYFWDWPRRRPEVRKTEWTFSTRLERLVLQHGWRSRIAWPIAVALNWIAPPNKPHIRNAA